MADGATAMDAIAEDHSGKRPPLAGNINSKLHKETVMSIPVAHLQEQGIHFAVFDADARSGSSAGRAALLARLTAMARTQGLRVEKSALAFVESGRLTYYGTPDLVKFLSNNGVPRWTHVLHPE